MVNLANSFTALFSLVAASAAAARLQPQRMDTEQVEARSANAHALALAERKAPPPLKEGASSNVCKNYTHGEGTAAVCPILGGLIGLQFVGYIGNTAADQILIHTINNALLADDNPLNVLLGPIGKTVNEVLAEGNMAISDSLYAPGAAFIALGALIQEADPQCRCDLASCTSAMYGASQATAFNNDNAQAACSQMEFQCGPYYSYKEMTKAVPGCAKVPHKPTDAPREGDIHRNAPYDGQPGGDPSNPENQEAYDPKKDGKKSKGANHKGANHKKNHASKENGQKASVSAHKNSKSRRLAEEPEEDHGHDQEGSNDVVDRG